jgi:hypothetical protein
MSLFASDNVIETTDTLLILINIIYMVGVHYNGIYVSITTQYIFHRTNFSYSQCKGVPCSVIILFSCSESLLATISCSWLLHPNPYPLADLSISHINARSLYVCDTDFKSNRTQSDLYIFISAIRCSKLRISISTRRSIIGNPLHT